MKREGISKTIMVGDREKEKGGDRERERVCTTVYTDNTQNKMVIKDEKKAEIKKKKRNKEIEK
jgi:hypothetical protein